VADRSLNHERSIDAKIARLRQRLKDTPIDANLRAILLGVLDLLGDEL
jgi:protein involved in temperature-dependent protein secretion